MSVASACGAIVDVASTTKVELQMWLFYKREREKKGGIASTFPPHSGTEPPFHTRSILPTPSLESPILSHLEYPLLCTYFIGIDRLG
jgi:hypothetical protein